MATKQTVAVQLFYDGVWNDLVAADQVFTQSPITITQGMADESSALRPASLLLQLDNRTDKFRPTNPVSSLYGKAGRNTPTRVQVGGVTRAAVELSRVECDQTRDFRLSPLRGRSWADVQAGGLLQRINQWSKVLRSPLYRYTSRLDASIISGYWPAEQDRGSTSLFSTVDGTRAGFFQGVAFDSQTRPPGSAPVMDISGDNAEVGGYFATVPGGSTTAGWQLSWVGRYEPLAAGEQDVMDWQTIDGTAYGLYIDSTTKNVLVYSASNDGVPVIAGASGSYGTYDWGQWTLFSVDAQYSAGTTTISVNWINGAGTQNGFFQTTFAGVPSRLEWWDMSIFAGVPDGSTVGHIVGANASSLSVVDLFGPKRRAAFIGHVGERAGARFARLCDEEGIPYYVGAAYPSSMPLGVQAVDTLPNLFKEIMASDDGLIYDVTDEIRLQYVSAADRYRQTVKLALTPAHFPSLPKEVFDDKGIANVVTASQRDGGEYTVSDDTGPMGTQPPPNGVGEYRQTVNVTVAKDLPQIANWWLKRGTVDLPRFPQLTLDLVAVPSLVASVNALRVDDVIEITGFRENVIRLHVLGWTEVIGNNSRKITYNCAPDQQFYIGRWDAADSRWGSATHTLKTTAAAGAVSLTFRSLSSKVMWSTTGTPYDVMIAGERVTVTTMGAPALVGGGYDQVATVTRAVNGIAKSLPAGSSINIATPGRWGI